MFVFVFVFVYAFSIQHSRICRALPITQVTAKYYIHNDSFTNKTDFSQEYKRCQGRGVRGLPGMGGRGGGDVHSHNMRAQIVRETGKQHKTIISSTYSA